MEIKDYKTIMFHKLAQSIGATKIDANKSEIDINNLILDSFLFLTKNGVLTHKQTKELEVFKDHYNRYVEYCIEHNLIDKDKVHKVDDLNITTVPDMSKIDKPDISKELKEMNIDIDKFIDMFSGLANR